MNIEQIRSYFPILKEKVHNKPLIYFDNAATTQVPKQVLKTIEQHIETNNANIHRSMHTLGMRSTNAVENIRIKVGDFIKAKEPRQEIIFTSGTSASLNMLAYSMENNLIKAGDIVLSTDMEHHSNYVPWQQVCLRTGAEFAVVPMNKYGQLDIEALKRLLLYRPKVLAVTYVSNVSGIANPIEKIIELAHNAGTLVVVDAAQAMRHFEIDVTKLDCDFLAFSAHKMMGPSGIGCLYGKRELLEQLPPANFGGGMVDIVDQKYTTYAELPFKFEAGTPNIIGIIGLGAAIDYLSEYGILEISKQEQTLINEIVTGLQTIPEAEIIGSSVNRFGAVSFTLNNLTATDTALLFDTFGIAVRSGHHCAQPLLHHFGKKSAIRVSPAFYNTECEVKDFFDALDKIIYLSKR